MWLILLLLFQLLLCSLTLFPTLTLCFSQTPEELEDDSDFEQEDYDTRSRTSVQTEDDQLIAGQSARVSQCSLPHCAVTSHMWHSFGTWHKKVYFRKHLFDLGKVWATCPNSVYTISDCSVVASISGWGASWTAAHPTSHHLSLATLKSIHPTKFHLHSMKVCLNYPNMRDYFK